MAERRLFDWQFRGFGQAARAVRPILLFLEGLPISGGSSPASTRCRSARGMQVLPGGSLAFILNGSWRSNYRQAGYVNGVGLSFPFETLSMVQAALSITLPGRILSKDGKLKPLVHRMLTKKLPGSGLPEKSGSGLPRTRYCQEGPFKGFFLDHPVPGYWPDEWADLLRNPTRESSSLVLKCASLQMWEEEVLGNSRIDQMGSEFP